MKKICFYFQIHQPYRLKRYRFFNIGRDHYYYDDFSNEDILQQIAARSYVPANKMLLDLIKSTNGEFRFAISVSGVALDQMEIHAPEVIDGLKQLSRTGAVEFLAETYSHSLSSLVDPIEFQDQVRRQAEKIKLLFDQEPKVLRNTEMIYSDDIADLAYSMGYTKMISEGAKHVLSWRSPNFVYKSENQPNLKLLLRNTQFSDDISLRFADYTWKEYPLTADKYMSWIAATSPEEEVFNLFMNYETFGNLQPSHSGIFEFMKALPKFAKDKGISFATPSEIMDIYKPVGTISVPSAISWADEERDLSRWLGNTLQRSAFNSLYEVSERVRMTNDRRLKQDWSYLQTSDHFYYMSTKHFYDGSNHSQFSPYQSPYDAFNNYMNVLSDFIERVKSQYPDTVDNEELNSLLTTIHNQEFEIKKLQSELNKVLSENEAMLVKKKSKPKASNNKGNDNKAKK